MIDLGLTASERSAYIRALERDSRRLRLRVSILDRNEKYHAELSVPARQVLDGQVNVDADGDVGLSLDLTVLDPHDKLYFDPDAPSHTALYMDRFIAIEREDYVDELDRFVSCPVFWGPLTRFRRRGKAINVEAQSKELLAQPPEMLWVTKTYPKGANKIATIRAILALAGEKRFSLPESSARLPRPLPISRHDSGWPKAKHIAGSMHRQIFYDYRGRVRVRVPPRRSGFTFYRGHDPERARTVVGEPQISFDMLEGFCNVVEVLGGTPKGAKRRIRYLAVPPRAHPLSPWSMARNGRPRRIVTVIENDQILRQADAEEIGERHLAQRLGMSLAISFEALPIPFLEPRDVVTLVTDNDTYSFPLRQFTIPLTAEGRMSIGSTTAKKPRKRKRR